MGSRVSTPRGLLAVFAWMLAGNFAMVLLAYGILSGVDHGLHRHHFFGPVASVAIGWGAGGVGALLGRIAAR